MSRALAAGTSFGLVIANRPEAAFFPVLLLASAAIANKIISKTNVRPLLRGILPYAFGVVLILLPWMARNYQSVGSWYLVVPNSNGTAWANIFIDPWSSEERDRWGEILTRERQKLKVKYDYDHNNPVQREAVYNVELRNYLLQNPLDYVIKVLKRSVAYWFIETKIWWTLFNLAIQTPVILMALYGIVSAWQRNPLVTYPLVLWIVYLNVVFALVSAELRYAVPAMPAVFVFAAYGTVRLFQRNMGTSIAAPSPAGRPFTS